MKEYYPLNPQEPRINKGNTNTQRSVNFTTYVSSSPCRDDQFAVETKYQAISSW